jgi:hypothetical protein
VRASDVSPIVDVSGIQTYTVNQARVVFVRPRPTAKPVPPGGPGGCRVCRRVLRESSAYCSLECKVVALVAAGQLGPVALDGSTGAAGAACGCGSDNEESGGGWTGVAVQGASSSWCPHPAVANAPSSPMIGLPSKRDSEGSEQTQVAPSGAWRRKQALPRRSPYC